MQVALISMIAIVLVVVILNLFIFGNRAMKRTRRGKGRNYTPPAEVRQAEWRDREIARRIAQEQSNALNRVNLRNDTLAYYKAVKERHEKIETLERLGMPVNLEEIDAMTQLSLDEYLNMR